MQLFIAMESFNNLSRPIRNCAAALPVEVYKVLHCIEVHIQPAKGAGKEKEGGGGRAAIQSRPSCTQSSCRNEI